MHVPLAKSLDDPVFGARLPAVEEDLSYHVEFAAEVSEKYRITVFDFPTVVRVDAKLVFPGIQ